MEEVRGSARSASRALPSLRCGRVEQRQITIGQSPLGARTDRQSADPTSRAVEPTDFDRVEPERSELREPADFHHRLGSLRGDRLEREAPDLSRA